MRSHLGLPAEMRVCGVVDGNQDSRVSSSECGAAVDVNTALLLPLTCIHTLCHAVCGSHPKVASITPSLKSRLALQLMLAPKTPNQKTAMRWK